jgi:hypothetical protein
MLPLIDERRKGAQSKADRVQRRLVVFGVA